MWTYNWANSRTGSKTQRNTKERQDQEDYSSGSWLRLLGKREIAAIGKSAAKGYCAK